MWGNCFNAVPTQMIAKLMQVDPDDWCEVTLPTVGDRVYVFDTGSGMMMDCQCEGRCGHSVIAVMNTGLMVDTAMTASWLCCSVASAPSRALSSAISSALTVRAISGTHPVARRPASITLLKARNFPTVLVPIKATNELYRLAAEERGKSVEQDGDVYDSSSA